MSDGFRGAIFDVDGVLVDSPHEQAWRQSLQELMEGPWSDIREQTTWTPEGFTSEVYHQRMSGKPRKAGATAALIWATPSDRVSSKSSTWPAVAAKATSVTRSVPVARTARAARSAVPAQAQASQSVKAIR